ncbi:MAG: diguanylate cyclase [Rhodocyclaceae bacterium]|nr:diguanylate cyclase [Rhodocyclaceae bacterium]
MSHIPAVLDDHLTSLDLSWRGYRERGGFDDFVEFTLAINCVAEHLANLKLPGLLRQCQGLESAAISLFGGRDSHPVATERLHALQRQIDTLLRSIDLARPPERTQRQAQSGRRPHRADEEWTRPHSAWMVCAAGLPWARGLQEQLEFFGFSVQRFDWSDAVPAGDAPLAILFMPGAAGYGPGELDTVRRLRESQPSSQCFCLGAEQSLAALVELLRVGADVTIAGDAQTASVIERMLDLLQAHDRAPYRVLIVEDSPTAVAMVRRALANKEIDSDAIDDPRRLLEAVTRYQPDLILMDMYMPHCTGVEATRVLRQIPAYQSLPVVYLSSEQDVAMQIEALRLGGDQFLTKPVNPVLLAAVVNNKIERFRDMQRSSLHDSLTGLFNHSAIKSQFKQMLAATSAGAEGLCVAMLDIDHFKAVNDTYGHPVGDQVIRSLAWLLKGRLRSSDLIGRYGGEEFMVVLPGASPDQAHAVLDRIREDFSTLPHAHAGGTLFTTFSAGLACCDGAEGSPDTLTRRADEALLEAKRQGRNRVVAPTASDPGDH